MDIKIFKNGSRILNSKTSLKLVETSKQLFPLNNFQMDFFYFGSLCQGGKMAKYCIKFFTPRRQLCKNQSGSIDWYDVNDICEARSCPFCKKYICSNSQYWL